MEFLLSCGLDLKPFWEHLRLECIEHHALNTVVFQEGPISAFIHGSRLGGPADIGRTLAVFDGQFSADGRLYHSTLPYKEEKLVSIAGKISKSAGAASPTGIYCILYKMINNKNGSIFNIFIDPINQYPVYYIDMVEGYLVSNSINLISRLLNSSGISAERSLWPCVENLVFGGVVGDKTHVSEVKRVPFGTYVEAGRKLNFRQVVCIDDHGLSYAERIARARLSIQQHVDSISSTVLRKSELVVDLTGGSDSRAVLSFLGKSSLRPALKARCLTRYPHPDANVAGYLMSKYQLPKARMPVNQGSIEQAVRMNANFSGGARDTGTVLLPYAMADFVHFRGTFGELSGATPGIDYIAESMGKEGHIYRNAVDLLLSRRRMAGALELLRPEAIESVAHNIIAEFEVIEAEGRQLEHFIAELYLRARCRTHFGLLSFLENRSRVLPDILANPWIVSARRALPARLHTKNKINLDLILANGDESLAFAPMADKRWAQEIVEERNIDQWSNMQIVSVNAEPLSDYRDSLFESVSMNSIMANNPPSLLKRSVASGSGIYPHERFIRTYQELLNFVLENFSSENPIWDVFGRDAFELNAGKDPSSFHHNGISTHAMGNALAGIFWFHGLGISPKIEAAMRFAR